MTRSKTLPFREASAKQREALAKHRHEQRAEKQEQEEITLQITEPAVLIERKERKEKKEKPAVKVCAYCDNTGTNYHLRYCPANPYGKNGENSIIDDIHCPEFRWRTKGFNGSKMNSIRLTNGRYAVICSEMSNSWIIRNNQGEYQYLFMHGDNWGQYGKDTSHLPRYKAFIDGYIELKV
jgi:hypothetical protein